MGCGSKAAIPVALPPDSVEPLSWDVSCPGSDREVHYDASVTMGTYTIATPGGMRQGEVYGQLHGSAPGAGLKFCMSPGSPVVILVQNTSSSGGVNCRIAVDGATIARNNSYGPYAVVTCEGSA